jgi:RimJ/RimL family protein N-acetyltransferase
VFFAAEDRGKIVSLVGTHVVSTIYKLAAVGNAYTHPNYRGKGYFRTCLSAVLERLFSMGITDVVANVIQDNLPSLKGALSVGFKKHCPYWEGIAYRR